MPVEFTYCVSNCGCVTVTGVTVTDDAGTPDRTEDDFVVA